MAVDLGDSLDDLLDCLLESQRVSLKVDRWDWMMELMLE
jgi:hypothetical protein